jgi:dipeptidyl aminopeptidase/acylaminoacyl peptidase
MAARMMKAEDLWKLPRVGVPAVASGGAFVVVGVTTYDVAANEGRERLWLASTAERGEARALTAAEASSSQPAISPDGRMLAFVRKPQGSRVRQLWVMPLDGGEARRVTDLPLGVQDPKWLPDGTRVVVVAPLLRDAMTIEGTRVLAKEREVRAVKAHVTENRLYRFWDKWLTSGEVPHLFVIDVATGEARDLTADSDRYFDWMEDTGQYDVSPDGAEVAFAANVTSAPYATLRWALFTAPVAGGATRRITAGDAGDAVAPRYSPDGGSIVYGARKRAFDYADRVRIARFDRRAGTHAILTETWDRSASEWAFDEAGRLLVCVEDRARTGLYRMRLEGESASPELVVHGGQLHGVRAAGGRLYAQHASLRQPPEVARIDEGARAIDRITRFTEPALRDVALGEVRAIDLMGAGGDRIQMHVILPPAFDKTRKWPLVHFIHGGPYGHFGDQWHWRWNAQVVAAAGYVVAAVDFHGSSSYGEAFARSIEGDWGGKSADDILLATDHLLATGFVDADRMAITGGSFGGYMTAWLATRTRRFRCAIAHAAVYDLPAMWATDAPYEQEREFGGAPWLGADDRAKLARFDPAAHADGLATPMLVIHGGLDYRVPATQALELYGILKAKGVEARLVYYEDENHWILKPQNSLHWYGEFLGWLARYLA